MLTSTERAPLIAYLREFPARLEALVNGLTPTQLTTPPVGVMQGEWTIAQNVHHLADSHLNAYIRFKLILLEAVPTVKPYQQDAWAATADSIPADIAPSLAILRGLHDRWTTLMQSIPEAAWARVGHHPEVGEISLEWILTHYVDHCDGHLDQITRTLNALS